MTETRDIRFTLDQIKALEWGARDEIKKRRQSIERAEANIAAGATVKPNVLDEHYRMREAARTALEALQVARRNLERREIGS